MIDKDLIKHALEFKQRIGAHKYEMSAEGMYFPGANALIFGEYTHSVNGGDERTDRNLITLEGISHLLEIGLAGGLQKSMWFLAIYKGSYTPTSTLTASQFPTTADEIVSPTDGYGETTRPVWKPDPAIAGSIENASQKSSFSIVSPNSVVITGAALLSEQIKGANTGILMSASRFSTPREQYTGDTFSLGYRVRIQAA